MRITSLVLLLTLTSACAKRAVNSQSNSAVRANVSGVSSSLLSQIDLDLKKKLRLGLEHVANRISGPNVKLGAKDLLRRVNHPTANLATFLDNAPFDATEDAGYGFTKYTKHARVAYANGSRRCEVGIQVSVTASTSLDDIQPAFRRPKYVAQKLFGYVSEDELSISESRCSFK